MPSFDSTKISLKALLDLIIEGKIQLPDFQRGWIWDDEHIRSLLVSIGRSFPIGSIMLLETGGNVHFQVRPIEGVIPPSENVKVENLILDGQQRLTSLTQALRLMNPIKTRSSQNHEITRFYYINIVKAIKANGNLEEAIIGVDESKLQKENFGRDIVLDLSTPVKEFENFYFPCNQILNSDSWEEQLMAFDQDIFPRYMQFRAAILNKYREYEVPIIQLKKENTKEAVCLVFEKVNTGGVPLSVFDLMTATYAADGFNLRDDWFGNISKGITGRKNTLREKPLLSTIEPTDFLQGITLLFTYERHTSDIQKGLAGKEVNAISAKREQVLMLPLSAYQRWADKLVSGLIEVDRFLRMQGFRSLNYLPYRSQLVALACVMVNLRERWLEPVIYDKLVRWYWCGVFGELYGGATETRIALDVQDLLSWIEDPSAQEPATVIAAGFQESRLDTLRTRTSAAYRGLYILFQRQLSKDFFWKVDIMGLDQDDCGIDIHHIFPVAWCKDHKIPDRVFNAIVNKTAISSKANRMIGGNAPSYYLQQLRNDERVRISIEAQNEILESHLIPPEFLHSDDFEGFYKERKRRLITMIEAVMGKKIYQSSGESSEIFEETSEDYE